MTTGRASDPARTRSLALPDLRAARSAAAVGAVLIARIEQHTGPGDVVADLAGRGGWVARAALDRQRRAISIESTPLTRMLAEVVLRPPDVRHLDAAFQGMAASPRAREQPQGLARRPVRDALRDVRPDARRRRDRLGGRRRRRAAAPRRADLPLHGLPRPARRRGAPPRAARRRGPRPGPGRGRRRGGAGLGRATDSRGRRGAGPRRRADRPAHRPPARRRSSRSSSASRATCGRRRSWPPCAWRSCTRSCRPAGWPGPGGRPLALRIAGGHVRAADRRARSASATRGSPSRRRSGSSAASSSASRGPPARSRRASARTCARWGRGPPAPSSRSPARRPSATLRDGALVDGRVATGPRVRLVLGQPAIRPEPGAPRRRLSRDGLGARPRGGLAAAHRRPGAVLAAAPVVVAGRGHRPVAGGRRAVDRPRRPGRPARRRRSGGDRRGRDRRRVGRLPAGRRPARPSPTTIAPGVVELIPPGAAVPPGPRTRANVGLDPVPGGAGDPDLVPGPGLFAPPERFDQRPFSATEAARVVTDAAVETLQARGEPARFERLFGEILVGPRPVRPAPPAGGRLAAVRRRRRADGDTAGDTSLPDPAAFRAADAASEPRGAASRRTASTGRDGRRPGRTADAEPADPVERLLAAHPRRVRPRRASSASSRSSPVAGGWPTGRIARPRRRRSPTASSGPCSACCRPPVR